jgi:hypothetical protein
MGLAAGASQITHEERQAQETRHTPYKNQRIDQAAQI